MVTLVHSFVSSVADDPSVPQEVRPSNWNANHALLGGAAGQLVYDSGGAPAETTSPLVPTGGSGLAFTGPNITTTTGSDLLTDGNLATDPTLSGWSLHDNVWSAGQISGTLTDVNNSDMRIKVPITVAAATWYVVELHVTMTGGDGPAVYFDGAGVGGSQLTGGGTPIPPPTTAQVYKFPVFCNASGSNHLTVDFNFYLYNGSSWVVTFLSMKQMATPLPVPQLEITNYAGLQVFNSLGAECLFSFALGAGALKNNTTGDNIGIGNNAGALLTIENRNVAIGNDAMALAVGGGFSVAIGEFALLVNQGGNNNAVGSECLYNCLTGSHNQGFGANVMFSLTTGAYNQGFGDHCGQNITTGSHNVMVGYGAGGSNLVTGSNCILIGDQVDVPSDQSNYLNIGYAIEGNYSTGPLTVNVPWIQAAIQKSGVPATTDIAAGQAAVFKDTSGGGVYLAYNDAGTIKKVALT